MVVVALLVAGCGPTVPFAPVGRDAGPPPACLGVEAAGLSCVADVAYRCDGVSDFAVETTDCARMGQECVSGMGCLPCAPDRVRCDGEVLSICRDDGSGYDVFETCDAAAGLHCSPDGCLDLCARAAETESYIGCEYTPVTLSNRQLSPSFTFAIAVANPQLIAASVDVSGGALEAPRAITVAPGALEIVELPWVDRLRGTDEEAIASVRVPGGAYRVRSNVPVTVTQFNPLSFRLGTACLDRSCFSYTNDASLLLPTHALTGSYLVTARATQHLTVAGLLSVIPGFVTLVGVGEAPVEVEIRSRAATVSGADFPALVPGTPRTITLSPGEVVQIVSDAPGPCPGATRTETGPDGSELVYCDVGPGFDLTGTEIRADGPLAVFAGHDCTFVPYDRWACDHLEEQMFPVEALGNDLFVPITDPLRDDEPNLLRVVSAVDGNVVRFEPPLVAGEPERTLNRGEWLEVELRAAHWVRGTGPLLGALYLVGQDYAGLGSAARGGGGPAIGDPAMALVVPNAQFRTSYAFLAPATYTRNTATLVAPIAARVELDGRIVPLRPVEGTSMGIAYVDVAAGVHSASSVVGFGIYLAGYASYTSYFVPGGMDFVPIAPPL